MDRSREGDNMALKSQVLRSRLVAGCDQVTRQSTSNISCANSILVEGVPGYLILTGFDGETGLRLSVPAEVEETGKAVLIGRTTNDILKALEEGPVTLDASQDGFVLLACGRASFELQTTPVESYPELPAAEENTSTLTAGQLASLIDRVAYAASTDQTRATMTGILLESDGSCLTAVCTDGHRLAKAEAVTTASEFKELILPSDGAKELARHLAKLDGDAEVTIRWSSAVFVAEWEGTQFTSRLITGVYPAWKRVMPSGDASVTLEVETVALQGAIKRTGILARENANKVAITIANDSATMRAQASTGKVEETISGAILGEDMVVGCNYRYIGDACSAIKTEKIVLSFRGIVAPMTITSPDCPGDVHIIMPMQVG